MGKIGKILGTSFVILIMFMLLFASVSYAEIKFGYVDFVQVFNNYKKTISTEKELEKKGEKKQKEHDKMVTQVRKLKDKFEIASDAEKEKIQNQINEKLRNCKPLIKKLAKSYSKKKMMRLKKLLKSLMR